MIKNNVISKNRSNQAHNAYFKNIFWYLFPIFIFSYIILIATWNIEAKSLEKSEDNLQNVTLQLPWLHQFQFAGYYAAVEKRYYKNAGLRVNIIEGKPGLSPVEEVISERVNYGVGRSEILLHRMHGEPIIVLAAIMQHSAIIFLTKSETGISTPHDMIGHRVMMLKGDNAAEYIAMFRNEGISLEQIKIIPSSYDINDLIDGNTDVFNAYSTNEPHYLEIKNIPATIIRPINYGIDFYGDCLFTSERELKENPSRVKAFRAASIRGWEYAMAHPEEIINIILTQYRGKNTREHLVFEANALRKLILPDLIQLGHMNPGRWHHMANTYVELGMADADFSLEGFIYNPNPNPDYRWMKWALIVVLFLILLIGLGFSLLYFHNKKLRSEINQRLKSENDLRGKKIQLRQIIDLVPYPIFVKDETGKFEIVNKAIAEIFGTTVEDLTGRRDTEFVATEEEMKSLRSDDLEVLKSGKTKFIPEQPITDSENNIRYLQIIKVPFKFSATNKPSLLGVAVDITERKHAEEALLIEKNNLNNILNSMNDGVYIVNQQYDIEFVNQALKKEFGSYEGKKCYEYFHDRQDVCTWCKNHEVISGKTVRWEWYSSKNKRTYDLIDSPIILANRSIGKLEMFRDITERKKTEEILRLSKRILEASPDHISVVGRNFIYKYVNNAYSNAHGLSTNQITGMHVAELLGKQTFACLVKPLLKKCLAGEEVQFESWFTFQKAGQRFMSVKYLPLWTKNEKIDGCVVLSIDITEHKKAEEEILLARKTAEDANKAKSEFLANMSHEIRTPLNAINGFSELLLPLVTDKKQKNYLKSIKTAGKSLLSLINDILDLSKIEADKMQIQYTPVNIQVIFDEIKQIFNTPLTDKSIEFSIDIDKNIPHLLLLDEIRLRQILLNLVGNAIKFTKEGYIKLMAKQTCSKDNKRKIDLEISVKDTGIGIAKADQDKIFNIFEQQDGQSTRAFGGTGLGLAISKRLAKMMNGQIKVASKVNGGSTFTILLRDVEVSTVKMAAVAVGTDDIDNMVFEKANILVVDDVRSNREFLSEALDQANLNVRTAENGQEAILLAREYQPDIIIMDIKMPVLDGFEATKYLKQHPETKQIPVIILSASPNVEYKTKLSKIGIDSFLSKPVTKNKLFNELAKHIGYTTNNIIDIVQPEPDYPLIDIENSPELVKILKEDIFPFCGSLKNSGVMNDIEIFGNRVKELGKKFNIRALIKYGEGINESAQNYDLPDIETALKTIAAMIKKLN